MKSPNQLRLFLLMSRSIMIFVIQNVIFVSKNDILIDRISKNDPKMRNK